MFLANAMIDDTAYSAIELGEYEGTLPTRIPEALHWSKGTLSNPAEQHKINWFPFDFKMSICSGFTFLFTKMQMALKPSACLRISSGTPENPSAIWKYWNVKVCIYVFCKKWNLLVLRSLSSQRPFWWTCSNGIVCQWWKDPWPSWTKFWKRTWNCITQMNNFLKT